MNGEGNPSGTTSPPAPAIPSLRTPDIQLLMQDYAQARRELSEEKRSSDKRVAEERERSRWETQRLRTELEAQIKGLERENEALVRTVGRIQGENDRLREENAIFRFTKTNGHTAAVEEKPEKPQGKTDSIAAPSYSPMKGLEVSLVLPPNPMGKNPLGGAQMIVPKP